MKPPDPIDPTILQIDELRLDREWTRQPKLMWEFGERLADARRDHEAAKNVLEATAAEVDAEIRKDPKAFGLDKVTEAVVKNAVVLCEDYETTQAEVLQAKHRVDVLAAIVNALEHKRRALENLVSLHGMSYFAEPRPRSDADCEAMEDLKRKAARRPTKRKKAPTK